MDPILDIRELRNTDGFKHAKALIKYLSGADKLASKHLWQFAKDGEIENLELARITICRLRDAADDAVESLQALVDAANSHIANKPA